MFTKNELIKKLNEFYKKRSINRQIELKSCYDFLLNNEEFKVCDFNYRKALIEISKKDNTDDELNKLKVLLKEKYDIAKKLGVDLEKLENNYHCKKCLDTGIYEGIRCECYNKALNYLQIKNCGIDFKDLPAFSDANFDFDEDNLKEIFNKLHSWCNSYKNSKYKNITLIGGTGVGKTYLSRCMLREFLINGKNCLYLSSFNLDNLLLKYHTAFENDKNDILEPVLSCDFLFIDDLGTEPVYKNVTMEYLFLILNERLISGRHTIITTNLSLREIKEHYGDRLFTRIINKDTNLTLELCGKDKRLKIN